MPLPWLLLAATMLCHGLPALVPIDPLPGALARAALLVAGSALVWHWRRRPVASAAAVLVLGFGYTLVVAGVQLGQRLPAEEHRALQRLEGRVDGVPVARNGACRFAFVTTRVGGEARRLRLRTTWPDSACGGLQPGARYALMARTYLPAGFANPGTFDYEGWLFRERFDGTAWVDTRESPQRHGLSPDGWLDRQRLALSERLQASMPAARRHVAPLLAALTLGLRGEMPAVWWDALASTGTSHLFAISGLHVGLLTGTVLLLARRLVPAGGLAAPGGGGAGPARLPVLLAGLAAATYAALAGFSIPTRRALVAVAIVLGATLARRDCSAFQVLSRALLVVLLLDPMAPLAPGFWLSFAAVACLAVLAGRLRDGSQGAAVSSPGVLATLRALVTVQAGLWLAMGPLGLFLFDRVSLWSPLLNLLLIPLFSLVLLPLAFAALLAVALAAAPAAAALPWPCAWVACLAVMLADTLAPWLVAASAAGLDLTLSLLTWAAALPPGALDLHRPWWTLALAQGAVILCLLPGVPGRWAALPLALPLLLWRPPVPAPGAAALTLLDVGQGLAAVVRTHRHTLLFDAGPAFRSGASTGDLVVVPYLRAAGVRRLDRVVVSHGDNDHRGGVADVLARFPLAAGRIRMGGGGRVGARGVPYAPCVAGERWHWDGVSFAFLHPPDGGWRGNDGSCVLAVSVGKGAQARRLLLTGDIEARAEQRLLAADPEALRAEVVVAPHHGSRSSSTAAFVAAVAPSLVLFPSGFANRWGFPDPAVAARWADVGARSLITGRDGALTVRLSPGRAPRVRAHRRVRRHYWMRQSERRVPQQDQGL